MLNAASRHWLRLGIIASLVFAVALALHAPARLVLPMVAARLPVQLAWEEVQGTASELVIHGLTITLPDRRRAYFQQVDLRPAFLPLLWGQLGVDCTLQATQNERIAGRGRLGLRGWRLAELNGELSLDSLLPTLPEMELVGVEGMLRLQAEQVAARHGALPHAGRAVVSLERLRLPRLANDPLGSYQAELTAQQDGLAGTVATAADAALLRIEGRLTQEAEPPALLFKGRGRLAANAPASLDGILPLLGRATDNQVAIEQRLALR